MRAVGPSQASAEVCAYLLSRLLLLVLLALPDGPYKSVALLVKLGSWGQKPGPPQVSEPTRVVQDACCSSGACWDFGGLSKQCPSERGFSWLFQLVLAVPHPL